MNTYRLGSSPAVHAPGLIAWAINGYHFPRDRALMCKVVTETWSIPPEAADALLSKRAAFTVENATVVFQA